MNLEVRVDPATLVDVAVLALDGLLQVHHAAKDEAVEDLREVGEGRGDHAIGVVSHLRGCPDRVATRGACGLLLLVSVAAP